MASTSQPRDRLEDRRSEYDKMPGGMWKAVEASSGEIRMRKAEGRKRKEKVRK